MSEVKETPAVYVIGGPVQAGKGIYIARKADDELLSVCRARDFAYVLTPRQMGKSSLMERTVERLRAEGVRTVKIDLNQIGTEVTEEQWYLGILTVIESDLQLEADIFSWWDSHARLGTVQRLTLFFRDILLKEVKEPVVIFVDEIDSTLGLPFTDDLFAAIRYLYHARVETPEFERLTFVLIGVATPSDLIKDPKRTPFNIGRRVDLTDFTFEESLPLAKALGLPPAETEQIHRWVLEWTSGYPYLTQRLYRAIADSGRESWSKADVDALVASVFLGPMSRKDSNLQTVRDMLTKRAPDVEAVLTAYHEVLRGRRPVADEEQSVVKSHLKLSGVVCNQNGVLRVRNRIYREVFNEEWVSKHLPVNWRKRLVKVAAVLIATLLILSLPTAVFAIYQWRQAYRQREIAMNAWRDAETQRKRAEDAKTEVEKALKEAERQRAIAEQAAQREKTAKEQEVKQRQRAEEQQRVAVAARQEAERERQSAVRSAQVAHAAREEALAAAERERRAKDEVEKQRAYAEEQRLRAENQAALAEQRRLEAEAQRRRADLEASEAKRQHENAVRSQLASEAAFIADEPGSLIQSVLLASASLEKGYSAPAYQALAGGLRMLPKPLPSLKRKGTLTGVAFSPDGNYLVTAGEREDDDSSAPKEGPVVGPPVKTEVEDSGGSLWVWERDTGNEIPLKNPIRRITDLTSSMNGKYLATINQNEEAQVWSWEGSNLKAAGSPLKLSGDIMDFAISEDGKYLASIPYQESGAQSPATCCRVSVWDVSSSKLVSVFTLGSSLVVTFSPKEDYVLIGQRDGKARVWNFKTGQEVARVVHARKILGAAFSWDGKYFATAGDDFTVKVWGLGAPSVGEAPSATQGSAAPASGATSSETFNATPYADFRLSERAGRFAGWREYAELAFSPDGKYLAVTNQSNLAGVWSLYSGGARETLRLIHDDPVKSLAFSVDGHYMATASEDLARAWDISSPGSEFFSSYTQPLEASQNSSFTLIRPPYMVWTSREGDIRVAHIQEERFIGQFKDKPGMVGDELSENGKYLATVNEEHWRRDDKRQLASYNINIWDVRKGSRLSTITLKSLKDHEFDPEGRFLATLSREGVFQLWDSVSGREIEFTKEKNQVDSFFFSPDGRYLALEASAGGASTAHVFEVPSGRSVAKLKTAGTLESLGFSPDGRYLALNVLEGAASTAHVFEVLSSRSVASLKGEKKMGYVVFSPNGEYLAGANVEGDAVYLWAIGSGERIPITVGHKIPYVSFSPTGRYLLGGEPFGDEASVLWETRTGRLITRLEGGGNTFSGSIAFSPDDQYLAAKTATRISILEAATGCEVASVPGLLSADMIGFSPDKKYLLLRDDNRHDKILWQEADLRARVCSYVTRNLTSEEWHNQYMIDEKLPRLCDNLPENPDTGSGAKHCGDSGQLADK